MSLLFAFAYVKHFWSQTERDKCSAGTAMLGVAVALLAALLLPVDVFLVSYMKNDDGTFKVSIFLFRKMITVVLALVKFLISCVSLLQSYYFTEIEKKK